MIKPFIELKSPHDQYSFGDTTGVFIGTWCLIGIHHFWNTGEDAGWMFGLVLLNVAFGLTNI